MHLYQLYMNGDNLFHYLVEMQINKFLLTYISFQTHFFQGNIFESPMSFLDFFPEILRNFESV